MRHHAPLTIIVTFVLRVSFVRLATGLLRTNILTRIHKYHLRCGGPGGMPRSAPVKPPRLEEGMAPVLRWSVLSTPLSPIPALCGSRASSPTEVRLGFLLKEREG